MNREQRERHEQGETDYTNFRGFRVFHGKNTGDTPFFPSPTADTPFTNEGMKEADSSWKSVQSTGDTPFFVRGFRAFRG